MADPLLLHDDTTDFEDGTSLDRSDLPDTSTDSVSSEIQPVSATSDPDIQLDDGDLGYHKFTGRGREALYHSEMTLGDEDAIRTGATDSQQADDLAFKEAVIAKATEAATLEKTRLEEEKIEIEQSLTAAENKIREDPSKNDIYEELEAITASLGNYNIQIQRLTDNQAGNNTILADLKNQLELQLKLEKFHLKKQQKHRKIKEQGGLRLHQKLIKKTIRRNDEQYTEKNRQWNDESEAAYTNALTEVQETIKKTRQRIKDTETTIQSDQLSLNAYMEVQKALSSRYDSLIKDNSSWYTNLISLREKQKEQAKKISEAGQKLANIRGDVMKSDILEYRGENGRTLANALSVNGKDYFMHRNGSEITASEASEAGIGKIDEIDFSRQKEIQSIANQIRKREIFKYVNSDNLTEYMQYDENKGDFDFSEEAKQKTVLSDDLIDVENNRADGGGRVNNFFGFFGSLGGAIGSGAMDFINPYILAVQSLFDNPYLLGSGTQSSSEASEPGMLLSLFSRIGSAIANIKLGAIPGFDLVFKLLALSFDPSQNRGLMYERLPYGTAIADIIRNLFDNSVTNEILTAIHNLAGKITAIPKVGELFSKLKELKTRIANEPSIKQELSDLKNINVNKILPIQDMTLADIGRIIAGKVTNQVKNNAEVQTDAQKNLAFGELAGYGSMVLPAMFSNKLINAGIGTNLASPYNAPDSAFGKLLFNDKVAVDPTAFVSSAINLGKSIYGIAEAKKDINNQNLSKEAFAKRNLTRYSRVMQSASAESKITMAGHITDVGTNLIGTGLKAGGIAGLGITLINTGVGIAVKKILGGIIRKKNRKAILNDSKILGGINYDKKLVPEKNFNEIFASVTGINTPDDMVLSLQTIDAIDTHRALRASLSNPGADTKDIDEAMRSLGFRNKMQYPKIRVRDILKKTTGETDFRTVIRNSIMVNGLDYNTLLTRLVKVFSPKHYEKKRRKTRLEIATSLK